MADNQNLYDPNYSKLLATTKQYKYTSLYDFDKFGASLGAHVDSTVATLDPNLQSNFDSLAGQFPSLSKDVLLSAAQMGMNAKTPGIEKIVSADGIGQLKQDANNIQNLTSTAKQNKSFAENVWDTLVYNPFKAGTRVTFAALQFPKEFITAVGRDIYAASHGQADKVNLGSDLFGSTTLGQLGAAGYGALTGRGPVDTGSGFFITPESKVGAAQAKAMSAYGRIGGQSFTLGRALLNGIGEHPDTTIGRVMSGIVDAVIAVGTDPSTYFGPGAITKIARGGGEVNKGILSTLTGGLIKPKTGLAGGKQAAQNVLKYEETLQADKDAQAIIEQQNLTKEINKSVKEITKEEKSIRRSIDNTYLKESSNLQKAEQARATTELNQIEKLLTFKVKSAKTIEGSADIAALTNKVSVAKMVQDLMLNGKQSETVDKISRLSADYDNSGAALSGINFDEVPVPGKLHIGARDNEEYIAAVNKPLKLVDLTKTYEGTSLAERAAETDRRINFYLELSNKAEDVAIPEATRNALKDFIASTPMGTGKATESVLFGKGSETLANIIARAKDTGLRDVVDIVGSTIQDIWKGDGFSNVRSIFGQSGGVIVTNGEKIGARLVSLSDTLANNTLPRMGADAAVKLMNSLNTSEKAVRDAQTAYDAAKLNKDNVDKYLKDIEILRNYAEHDPELIQQIINDPENAALSKLMDLKVNIADKEYAKEFLKEKVGMIDSFAGAPRRDLKKAASFVLGKNFDGVAQVIAKETDFARVHRLFGRKLPVDMVLELTKATTKDEVLGIFLRHLAAPTSDPQVYRSLALKGSALLESSNPVYKLAPSISKNLIRGLGILEKTETKFGRYFVRQTVLPLGDLDRLVNGVEDWMSSALSNVVSSPEKMNQIIDETISKLAKTTTNEERSAAVYDIMAKVHAEIADAIAPGDTELAGKLKELMKPNPKDNALMKTYIAEKLAKGEVPDVVTVNGEKFNFGPDQALFLHQFLDDVIKLPDSQEIKRAISKYKDNKAIYGAKEAANILNSTFGDKWRTAQLAFRASYILRNVGEMQMRQYFSGHESLFNHPFKYIAMIAADPNGSSWRKFLTKMAPYKNDIMGARLIGKDLEVADSLNQSVQHLMEFLGRGINSQDIRNSFIGKIYEVIGNTDDAYHLGLTNTLVRFHSDKLVNLVSRAILDGTNQDQFVNALIHESDPAFEGLLKALINGGRNGVDTANFAKLFLRNTKKINDKFDFSPENFIPGNIKNYLFDLNSTGSIARVINNIAGSGEYANDIRKLLADGQVITSDGKKIALPSYKSLGSVEDMEKEDYALKRALSEAFPKDKMTDSQVINIKNKRLGKREIEFLDKGIDWFFNIATKMENVFNFAPEYRMSYWDYVARYVPQVSDEALKKIASEAEKSLAPLVINGKRISLMRHSSLKVIGKELKAREAGKVVENGLDVETVNSMAAKKASEYTKNLFYDAAKQRQVSNALRIVFPFAQAQFNTMYEWGKLLKDNPFQFYKVGRAYQALTKPGSSSIYDVTGIKYDDNQGFFYDDEYGQKRFRYPIAGSIIGGMVGQNVGASSALQLTAPVQSLNLAFGAVNPGIPGIGPVFQGAFLASGKTQAFGPAWDSIRNVIFPFGEPKDMFDVVVPSWFKKSFFGILNQKSVTERGTKDWASYLASTGKYGDNPFASTASRNQLFNDAYSISRWSTVMQGFFQSILPATPAQEVFAKDKDGKLQTQTMLYNSWSQILQNHPGDYWASVGEFADKFGIKNLLVVIGGSTRAVTGTKDAWAFLNNHPDMADKYAQLNNDIVPYFFPGGEAATAYYNWQVATKRRTPLPKEKLSQLTTNIVYQMMKSQISEKQAAGFLDQLQYNQAVTELNNAFEGAPPINEALFNVKENKIVSVGKALQEPAFKDSPIYKETLAFYNAYMSEYNGLKEMTGSINPTIGGKTGVGAVIASRLDNYAQQLIKINPAFARMYYGVFGGQVQRAQEVPNG